MRFLLATMLLASPGLAGAAPVDHSQQLGELSVCYLPVTRQDQYIRREPLFQLFGDLHSGEVLGAKYAPTLGAPVHFSAHGLMLQAIDQRSHADGESPGAPVGVSFALGYVSPASWVSFLGDLKLSSSETVIRVECFDHDVNPNEKPRASDYYVVGIASSLVSPWGATPDMPEIVKPQTDLNALSQCAGATRISDYQVTYEMFGGSRLWTVLVSAHYRCGEAQ